MRVTTGERGGRKSDSSPGPVFWQSASDPLRVFALKRCTSPAWVTSGEECAGERGRARARARQVNVADSDVVPQWRARKPTNPMSESTSKTTRRVSRPTQAALTPIHYWPMWRPDLR
ncbi:unnamed protein product [Pleuronectes platessa]|uniref:Uncharacterized protein n=1 Tax=Pleuronectes platessa TaxID=8262 RepID=A0A9N7V2D6_PLEPL|nr:unnamed protein product [Pleuronectes platessa]